MILKALCDFYDRESSCGKIEEGFERKNIPFVVLLKKDGRFAQLIDTRDNPSDKNDKGKVFVVPRANGRTIKIEANLLWDKAEYVFGIPKDNSPKGLESSKKKIEAFRALAEKISDAFPNNGEFAAVHAFLNSAPEIKSALDSPNFPSDKPEKIFSFRIEGKEKLVCEHSDVAKFLKHSESGNENHESFCIVSGKRGIVKDTHKGFKLGRESGVKLVSFQKDSGYDSYGKTQGQNAPIISETEFKYATALEKLLSEKSGHRTRLGETAVVFWGDKPSEFENEISSFFGFNQTDNDGLGAPQIKNLYKSVHTGLNPAESGGRFFVLGIEANKARMVVRFWLSDSLENIAGNIRAYFDDLDIVKGKYDKDLFSLYNILAKLSLQEDIKNLPPSLSGDILKSAFTGALFPRNIQMQCLNRIRAESAAGKKDTPPAGWKVGHIRAALLKAYLNRKNRIYKLNEREIKMALDAENKNIGYLCGRLFAALEKIQKDANGENNSTIVDRYYGAASATPVVVFSRLMDLSTHHLSKIEKEKPGLAVNWRKLLQEIFDKFPSSGFPQHLSLDGQSRFAIGYYQQTQDFYKSNKTKTEEK